MWIRHPRLTRGMSSGPITWGPPGRDRGGGGLPARGRPGFWVDGVPGFNTSCGGRRSRRLRRTGPAARPGHWAPSVVVPTVRRCVGPRGRASRAKALLWLLSISRGEGVATCPAREAAEAALRRCRLLLVSLRWQPKRTTRARNGFGGDNTETRDKSCTAGSGGQGREVVAATRSSAAPSCSGRRDRRVVPLHSSACRCFGPRGHPNRRSFFCVLHFPLDSFSEHVCSGGLRSAEGGA